MFLCTSCNKVRGKNGDESFTEKRKEAIKVFNSGTYLLRHNSTVRDSVEECVRLIRKAIEIDSTYKLAYTQLASQLHDLGRTDEAIWALNKAEQLDTVSWGIPFIRGAYMEYLGDSLGAKIDFRRSIELCDRSITAAPSNLTVVMDKLFFYRLFVWL